MLSSTLLLWCCCVLPAPGDLFKDGCDDRKSPCFAIGTEVWVSQWIRCLWQSLEILPMQAGELWIRTVGIEETWK